MTLEAAISAVQGHAQRINELYQKTAFDEWAIVVIMGVKGRILHYSGPRKQDFQMNFARDVGAFAAEFRNPEQHIGDFHFARHALGTHCDAIVVMGEGVFLLCNNTTDSMAKICQDPLWLSAQVPFVEMSEQFRSDPLFHPV
jgi:hypothetical protein